MNFNKNGYLQDVIIGLKKGTVQLYIIRHGNSFISYIFIRCCQDYRYINLSDNHNYMVLLVHAIPADYPLHYITNVWIRRNCILLCFKILKISIVIHNISKVWYKSWHSRSIVLRAIHVYWHVYHAHSCCQGIL